MSDLTLHLPDFTFPDDVSAHTFSLCEAAQIPLLDLLTSDASELSRRCPKSSIIDIQYLINVLHNYLAPKFPSSSSTSTSGETPLLPTTIANVADNTSHPTKNPGTISLQAQPPQPQAWPQPRPPPPLTFSLLPSSTLNHLLGGGFPRGRITELVGAPGAGKTQILLSLLLSAQPSIYISTEAPLSTPRLQQILSSMTSSSSFSDSLQQQQQDGPHQYHPSLDNIHTITCHDLETQLHVTRYQLPILVHRLQARTVIIDSIAANFRGEGAGRSPKDLAMRAGELVRMVDVLRGVSKIGMEVEGWGGVAVVVANQVADRVGKEGLDGMTTTVSSGAGTLVPAGSGTPVHGLPMSIPTLDREWGKPSPSPSPQLAQYLGSTPIQPGQNSANPNPHLALEPLPLALDLQALPLSGYPNADKQPSLGFVWTSLIAGRVVVRRDEGSGRRWVAVVFADWVRETRVGEEVEVVVWEGGIGGRAEVEKWRMEREEVVGVGSDERIEEGEVDMIEEEGKDEEEGVHLVGRVEARLQVEGGGEGGELGGATEESGMASSTTPHHPTPDISETPHHHHHRRRRPSTDLSPDDTDPTTTTTTNLSFGLGKRLKLTTDDDNHNNKDAAPDNQYAYHPTGGLDPQEG
ncbi:P-loop containing nucleoside triphosphate hydrolase protein [Ascodesmis nigricans]|uniref:P-loop containing nucleoside triphosphate hydrolase protein n=1 Tax=Ascodesmis nigricans TaxID=341454 RepID=A0A4S2MQV2_9PEZI|nr:P-loop containing nucleoside triphosphate hydrolase protein [Ascodesmis nigricans]